MDAFKRATKRDVILSSTVMEKTVRVEWNRGFSIETILFPFEIQGKVMFVHFIDTKTLYTFYLYKCDDIQVCHLQFTKSVRLPYL